MRPQYERVEDSTLELYRYHEYGQRRAARPTLAVLFVPGNGGNHQQARRPPLRQSLFIPTPAIRHHYARTLAHAMLPGPFDRLGHPAILRRRRVLHAWHVGRTLRNGRRRAARAVGTRAARHRMHRAAVPRGGRAAPVSYTHLRAHETLMNL
eukprot:1193544-Prymnesium_polylepis.1